MLVLSHVNMEMGWIDRQWLTGIMLSPLYCPGRAPVFTRVTADSTIRQCPYDFCNPGHESVTDNIWVYCLFWQPIPWVAPINMTNKHVGWIMIGDLKTHEIPASC